uniref:Uncharacterized protein n=1 Tax=Anopheles arabiensis TaxID=7173 RepID=A0A182HQ27_ANOAR
MSRTDTVSSLTIRTRVLV